MRKFVLFLLLFVIVAPVFASVSGSTTGELSSDVFKPILQFMKIARIVLVLLIVIVAIVTGIKYASSSGDRRSEYIKNGIIAVIILAVIYFAAFSIPKLLGVSDISITESAVVLKDTVNLELISGN